MPTTTRHVRLTALGTLGIAGGNEIWSCSLKLILTPAGLGPVAAAVQSDVDELSAAAATAWTTFIEKNVSAGGGAYGALFSSNVRVTGVKAAAVGTDTRDDPALHSTITDIVVGGRGKLFANGASVGEPNSVGGSIPYSCALAITFKGGLYLRGAAAFGRIYLPCPNYWANAGGPAGRQMVDGLMDPITATYFAEAGAQLLEAINVAPLTSGRNGTVSNISTSEAAAGVRSQPIVEVSCDTRPDTVRRRSNAIGGQGRVTAEVG